MAALDQLSGLMSVINGVKGQSQTTTTSGGTKTQQTNVSDQGVQQLINSILAGPGGVKNIGARARSSGLYNSTSEDTLLGNLYATAANQAELARSPTVTTQAPSTSTTTSKGAGVGDLAAGLGGAFLASQALNIGAKVLGPSVSQGTDYITDLLGGLLGTSSGDSGSSTGKKSGNILDGIDFGGFGGSVGGTNASSGTGISTGEGYGLNTSTLGNFGGSGGVQGGKGLNFGMDLDSGAGSVGVSGLGAIGSVLGPLLGGLVGGSSSGGSSGGTSGGSVICTALKDKGLLDKELHLAGAKYLAQMNPVTVVGYQVWGRKIAVKIDQGHKGWTKFTLPFARSRTALLATSGTLADHLKHPLGTLTKFVGEPICFLIGSCVPEITFNFIRSTLHNPKGV